MKREINIQKVDGYGNGRKSCMVSVELELNNGNFTASADLWRQDYSDILMGGQCFDELLNDYPEIKDNDVFMEVYDLWNSYHLNESIPDKDLERIKSLIETDLVKEDLHKQEDLELEM